MDVIDVIDELIAHCEAWEPWARVMGDVCAGDAAQALRNLRAELAEAKRDADRYRWWRRFFVPDAPLLPDAVAEAYTGEELDAAIDAAMAGGE